MNQVNVNIQELNEKIKQESAFIDVINLEMRKVIVGQKHLVDSLLIGLLSDGHILLEGVPGLAKTLAINTLASIIDAKFSRIQFTPDLLPADLIGTMIYSQKKEEFVVKQGPIFANFILADEINRSPAKVQSAVITSYSIHYTKLYEVYVQDRMREKSKELYSWLEEGAHFYVCGDSKRMAPDVHQALVDVVTQHNGGKRAAAEEYVHHLKKARRYVEDVY